ncbi:MAG: response regulator [Verrucomicrobia bacterium]|nr:response regulator [Verrucomicrobiota bacterium]
MKKKKILVVEDENILALDIQGYLQSFGYHVVALADKAEEAVKLATKHKPDLVLMDIRLKGRMDGIDAGKQIWETLYIPVIYLTAYADKATLERAEKSRPYGYILKPFNSKDIETSVGMALSKHAEEKRVREKRDWLDKVLMSLGDAVITADLNDQITFLNPLAEDVTEWKSEQAIGLRTEKVFNVTSRQGASSIENPMSTALQGGEVITFTDQLVLTTKSGRQRRIYDSAAPIKDQEGKILGGVVVFQDITDSKPGAP